MVTGFMETEREIICVWWKYVTAHIFLLKIVLVPKGAYGSNGEGGGGCYKIEIIGARARIPWWGSMALTVKMGFSF